MTILLIISLLAIIALLLHVVLPHLAKQYFRRKFIRRAAGSPHVFLTFDDGPAAHTTPAILDLLQQHEAAATFFVLGKEAEKHPEIVREILNRGHAIGEHGYAHLHAWKSNPFTTLSDLRKGARAIAACSQQKTQLLRPPFGKLNLATLHYVWKTNKTLAFWTIDPKDYHAVDSKFIAEYVIQRMAPGEIILLHDGSYDSDRKCDRTVEALKLILESGRSRGFRFASLGNLPK